MTAIAASETHILGVPDFRRFLVARGLSNLSIQMQSVAVGWHVYDLTHDALALGYIGLSVFLPMVCLTLPAGDVADRFDRRFILAASYVLQLISAAAFLVLTLAGDTAVWPFYVVMALFGISRAFSSPASQSFVPFLVAREQVARAIAWSSSAYQTASILGPALGGLIYILGPAAVYACCFVLCAVGLVSIVRIRTHVKPGPVEAGMTAVQRLLAGIAFVRRKPIVLGAATLDMFAVLLGGATALLPIYARDILHVGPEGLGALRTAVAVGAVITALAVAHYSIERRAGLTMFGAIALFGVATMVFGISENFVLSLLALAVMGMADQVSVVTRNTLVQLATPENMRGRVSALHMLFVGTSNDLGEFRAGTMAAWIGAAPAVMVGGAGILGVVGLWMWLFPELRNVDRLIDVAPTPAP
jgi:MFS family permease